MKKENNVTIPTTMLKKFLGQKGMRVSPDAITKFKSLLVAWAREVSEKASEKASAGNRKTIYKEDLE